MKIQIIFLIIIICVNAKLRLFVSDKPIDRIGTRLYRKELLTDKFQSPKELAYDSSSRNLYFMYMDDYLQNSGRAFVNIVTKRTMKIKGIERNKATAVDTESGDVYFGSDDGLYKYNPITNEATKIGLYNMNIHKIVIRNNEMYVIDANTHPVYKIFDNGKMVVRVSDIETVMQFDVDNEKSVHLVNMDGVYCVYKSHEYVKNTDLDVVYQFMVEGNRTYGLSDGAIYDINCKDGKARKVASIDIFPNSFIFGDYGDIFYSVDDNIYRLTPLGSYVIYNIHKETSLSIVD